MFHCNGRKIAARNLYRRVYCVLFMMLLAAGNVFAEDDPIVIDPNADFSVFKVFSDLWNFLTELV